VLLVPGDPVDRFEVVRLLGEGGLAHVYLVRHRHLGSLHALKLLHVRGARARARFLQEGQVQARIRHPNVVPVTDVVELDDGIGLVMDYVDGPSLAEVLGGDEPLPRRDVPPLFDQMCRGVIAAHRAGVLHRDLKPANVLLAVSAQGIEARIGDFGIAKVVADFRDTPSLTEQGTFMGTFGYMAPEQLSDAKAVDARADVFSLGCILYEMVAGRAPYLRADRAATIRATLDGQHRPLGALCPDLPAPLVAAVERALQAQPGRRQDTVEALRADVAAAAAPLLGLDAPAAGESAREVITAPRAPDPPARPPDPPRRAAPTLRETIAPPPSQVRPDGPAPTAVPEPDPAAAQAWTGTERQAVPASRGRLLDETAAPRAETERPRAESDRPLVDFRRNRGPDLRAWAGVLLLVLAAVGAAGAFVAGSRADDITAADAHARTLARGLEGDFATLPSPLREALARGGTALDAPTAAFAEAPTVEARITRARELVRAMRGELAHQGRDPDAATTELARAGTQVEPLDEAVRRAEAALEATRALRDGPAAAVAAELGWVDLRAAGTAALAADGGR